MFLLRNKKTVFSYTLLFWGLKNINFYHFHFDELSHTYTNSYIKYGIIYFVFKGVAETYGFLSLKIAFTGILANSVEPCKMPPIATFHLGLHCLPKYLFNDNQNEKV